MLLAFNEDRVGAALPGAGLGELAQGASCLYLLLPGLVDKGYPAGAVDSPCPVGADVRARSG